MSTTTDAEEQTEKPKQQRRAPRKRSGSRPSRAPSATATAPAKISAKEATAQVLRRAHGPLHVKEIGERVLKMEGVSGLKGATPQATIAAMLSVENGKGKKGLFKRVDKGTYALREQTGEQKPQPDPPADSSEEKK